MQNRFTLDLTLPVAIVRKFQQTENKETMNYVLWYNKCECNGDGFLRRISNSVPVDLVRYAVRGVKDTIPQDRCLVTCDTCNSEPFVVLIRCAERALDVALDAEPVLIERRRRTEDCSINAFVHYSFAHPSTLDVEALQRILHYTEVNFLYVTTTYDTVAGVEDASVFKINLVKRKTPGCERDVDWFVGRIRAATQCTARIFELRYVSYFSILTGYGHGTIGVAEPYPRSAYRTNPRVFDSLHELRSTRKRSRHGHGT